MTLRAAAVLILLALGCGPPESGAPSGASGAAADDGPAAESALPLSQPPAEPIPPRPAGSYRLIVRAELAAGAAAPAGYRILRLPPRLEDFPPGAQVDRREVRKGRWRPYPGPEQPLIIDLKPTEDVAQDRWMIVAYAENELRSFRYADNGFRLVELGSSPSFTLDPAGGEREVTVAVDRALRIQPDFGSASLHGPLPFILRYRPIAAAPRELRGDWSGQGPLPIALSRYAIGREATLLIEQPGWPAPLELGPVEFSLADGLNLVRCPPPADGGPLTLQVAPHATPDAPWPAAMVLASFPAEGGGWSLARAGTSDASGSLTLPDAHGGRYHLSARADNGAILLGWVAHGGGPTRAVISNPPILETGTPHFTELEEGDWTAEVWSFWGGLLVGRTLGRPDQPLSLPHAGEMRHQALLTREDPETGRTIAVLYLECEWEDGHWHFLGAPTSFEIESFTDADGLVMRLSLPERPEANQSFPPLAWQSEPGLPETTPWFPLPFRGGLVVRGLPEGQYEAGIFGLDQRTGRPSELATFYPIAEARE